MLGFLIALAAGYLTPAAVDIIGRPLSKSLSDYIRTEAGELRTLTFMVMLLGASLLATAFDSGSSCGVALGAVLGYFATRLATALRKAMDPPRR